MNTPTPETDEWIKSNVGLHVALENAIVHMRKLELQRDELQNALSGLCEHFGITPANSTLLAIELLRMKREVDRREITTKYNDAYFKTLKERDEAREKAERERDEARTTIEDAKRALNATDYEGILLAGMRVKEERDEARHQRNEWKQKYIQQNKDLGCEQMDPDGTIWDYAKKVQTDLSAMTEQRNEMAEILRDILAYNKGEKPHDYWALPHDTVTNMMAFDAWQEILRKIEKTLETKP